MELVYLWVEEYKNIHKQGFNFSPKFNCNYDPDTNELTIDENDDYIENFFGDNINVTAIVGKNGSGKSSVLEILQRILNVNFFTRIADNSDLRFILLLNTATELHENDDFFDFEKKIIALTNIEEVGVPVNKVGSRNHRELDDLLNPLFLDSELPYNKFNKYEIAGRNFKYESDFNIFKKFYYVDLDYDVICKKIIKLKNYDIGFIGFIPSHISVSPNSNMMDNQLNAFKYDLHTFPRFEKSIMENIELASKEIDSIEYTFLFSSFLKYSDRIEDDSDFENIINFLANDKEKSIEEKVNFLKENISRFSEDSPEEYMSILGEKKEIYTLDYTLLGKYDDYITIDIFDSKKRNFHSLSHGEKMLFGVGLFVYDCLQDEDSVVDDYVFCFDEPDISLHPHWQKNYLDIIFSVFSKFNKNIHLILTTHSPFLLSDIPKQNIIFLDTDEEGKCKVVDGLKEKKQTFGANIHTLLSDSFFMEDGLMGEFAKGKIDKAITLLNQEHLSDEELNYCEQIISIIGEPIVKNQLQRMLDSKRLKKIDEIDAIKSSMEAMQKRLDELEK